MVQQLEIAAEHYINLPKETLIGALVDRIPLERDQVKFIDFSRR